MDGAGEGIFGVDASRAAVVGPDIGSGGDERRFPESSRTPRLEIDQDFVGGVRGGEHNVDVVRSNVECVEVPLAMVTDPADGRVDDEACVLVEFGWRVGELLSAKGFTGRACGEEGGARDVVISIDGAVLVSVEVGAVGVEGEKMGEWGHAGSVMKFAIG